MLILPEGTPTNIGKLPRDPRGYPIPFFVAEQADGTRDLRFACPAKTQQCVDYDLCWVCGKKLGKQRVLMGGPLSVVNNKFADMPCHPSCGVFSAKNCPHIANPSAVRRTAATPGNVIVPGGSVGKNPGVLALVYHRVPSFWAEPPDIFARTFDAERVEWWSEGRIVGVEEAIRLWQPPPGMNDKDISWFANQMRPLSASAGRP